MRAHAATGNRAEVLRTFERCRHLLSEELDADPSAETDALHCRFSLPANGASHVAAG